ncbi:hypothetical protein ACFL3S_11810 [Gemmatimonadota bacterium]
MRGRVSRSVIATLAAFALSGCMDLNVTNVNEPDSERALSRDQNAWARIRVR